MKLNIRPVLGADVGLSLVLMQMAAHHQITPELVMCDLAISHCVYGRDRLQDQVALARTNHEPFFEENLNLWNYSTSFANLVAFFYLIQFKSTGCIPLISFISNGYTKSKTFLGPAKPVLIGALWAYAIVFLPPDSVPNDLFLVYSSIYSAVSNIADIKDIEQDKLDEVNTIPVLLGEKSSYMVSSVLAGLAIATHHTSQLTHSWTVGDSFIEFVSAIVFVYASLMSFE